MMDEYDHRIKWTCSITEKDAVWYHKHFKEPISSMESGTLNGTDFVNGKGITDEGSKHLVDRDAILKNLLQVSANEKQVVSKHYFHDALLTEKDIAVLKKKTTSANAASVTSVNASSMTTLDKSTPSNKNAEVTTPNGLAKKSNKSSPSKGNENETAETTPDGQTKKSKKSPPSKGDKNATSVTMPIFLAKTSDKTEPFKGNTPKEQRHLNEMPKKKSILAAFLGIDDDEFQSGTPKRAANKRLLVFDSDDGGDNCDESMAKLEMKAVSSDAVDHPFSNKN